MGRSWVCGGEDPWRAVTAFLGRNQISTGRREQGGVATAGVGDGPEEVGTLLVPLGLYACAGSLLSGCTQGSGSSRCH